MYLNLNYKILESEITYTGPELRPHWVLEQTGIYGSCIATFIGPCDVQTGELVDWEDRLANDSIRARRMLHFVGEIFGISLDTGVLCQRFFMVWAERLLKQRGIDVTRRGDDLYCKSLPDRPADHEFKMSVSIATATPVSVLLHWGLNIDATGAPPTVRPCGFGDFEWDDIEVLDFAKDLLTHYIEELKEIQVAQCKVRPVV